MADTCGEHGLLLEQLKHLTKSLDANTTTSNRLIERLERIATENGLAALELDHVKSVLAEAKADLKELESAVKVADGEKWEAINAIRAKLYIGVGLAMGGSIVISAAVAIIAAFIGKGSP